VLLSVCKSLLVNFWGVFLHEEGCAAVFFCAWGEFVGGGGGTYSVCPVVGSALAWRPIRVSGFPVWGVVDLGWV